MFEPPPIHLLRLAMRLHCVYINIHHKVLFPVSLFATNRENRVAKCMTALNFYILDKAATLHSYMHDVGGEVARHLAPEHRLVNLSASCEIHSVPEWHPFTSETV